MRETLTFGNNKQKTQTRTGWKVPASRMARETFNPIRNIVETMDLKPNPSKDMISLSIGDPTVFGNLKPDPVIIEAVKDSLESGKYNGYGSSTGFPEARDAVADHVSCTGAEITGEDVILCSGCSCALELCISALADPGDNILIPRPGFSLYSTLAIGSGINVKEYDLIPEENWEIDVDHLESLIDLETKAIIVNNPSNPCGSVYSKEHLEKILEVADRHCIPIIADEIYDHFVFPGNKYIPMASLTTTVPILSCGGLTKRFLVPGWRLGWITIHDRNNIFAAQVRNGLKCLSQRIIGANTIVQGALPIILKETPQNFFDDTIKTIQANAKVAYEHLSKIPGLKPIMPQGAMYMMVGMDKELFPAFDTDLEIVQAMIKEQSVFCLPGKCFNIPYFFRIVLTIPEKNMIEACQRIKEFCQTHVNESLASRMVKMAIGGESEESSEISGASGASDEEELQTITSDSEKKKTLPHTTSFSRRKWKNPPPLLRRETVTRLV